MLPLGLPAHVFLALRIIVLFFLYALLVVLIISWFAAGSKVETEYRLLVEQRERHKINDKDTLDK